MKYKLVSPTVTVKGHIVLGKLLFPVNPCSLIGSHITLGKGIISTKGLAGALCQFANAYVSLQSSRAC